MLRYGKTSQNAIMALSFLAERYDVRGGRSTSRDIATARNLPQPIVAKLLVVLSQAGLVAGAPGPRGGYWLARAPDAISLYDIVERFEKVSEKSACPFGADRCSSANPCPLHHKLAELDQQLVDFLRSNTLDQFTRELESDPDHTIAQVSCTR